MYDLEKVRKIQKELLQELKRTVCILCKDRALCLNDLEVHVLCSKCVVPKAITKLAETSEIIGAMEMAMEQDRLMDTLRPGKEGNGKK